MSRSTKETSLANLNEFIARQEAHLQRTRADIEKLDALRQRVRADPQQFVDNLTEELNDPAFRRPPVDYLRIPAVDWSLMSNIDPHAFDSLAFLPGRGTLRQSHPLREKLDEFVQESGLPPIERPSYRRADVGDTETEAGPAATRQTRDGSEEQDGDDSDDFLTDDDIPFLSTSEPGLSRPTSVLLPSNTHNQHWTTAEQRLLEKHLALIPPTEPQRWARISRAMKEEGADRAPRQVGSRVQKMYQKMEKMGVEPAGVLKGGLVGDGGRRKRKRMEREGVGKVGMGEGLEKGKGREGQGQLGATNGRPTAKIKQRKR